MKFFVAQRFSGAVKSPGRRLRGAGRLVANKFHVRHTMTPQERANRYMSRMPIAVITASLGGHPPDSVGGRR